MNEVRFQEKDNYFPAFKFGGPNESVHIAEDRVLIKDTSGTILFNGNADVRLELLPQPRIRIHIKNEAAEHRGIFTHPPTLRTTILESTMNGNQIEGFPASVSPFDSLVLWEPRYEPMIGVGTNNTKISYVIFHLFNFSEFIGTDHSVDQRGNSSHRINHVKFCADNWSIELRSLFETSEYIKKLNSEGGFSLTHIGRLKKSDGSTLTGEEAKIALFAVRDFLSFARGYWCCPVCSVGYDALGNRVWESWSSPKEPWRRGFSWFDPHHCEQLVQLFPGFIEKWKNDDWHKALYEVIYWYLNANQSSRGIDVGIILAQTAIERLSFEYSVREQKLIGRDGFKNLRASDIFRLLFSSLGIPLEIPTALSEMTELASASKPVWADSPHALTEIRNSLVHPEHKQKGEFSKALFEAWNLGLWYLEMALLNICGYRGSYNNRITNRWVGVVENVPW